MSRVALVALAVIASLTAVSAPTHAYDNGQKETFVRLRKAAEAPTFEGAKHLLDQIKAGDIVDPDLASYLAFSKRCADLSSDPGLPRGTYPGYLNILSKFNYPAVLHLLTKDGVTNAPSRAAHLASEALKIKDQIPTMRDIETLLAERYGLAPPERESPITLQDIAGQYSWRTTDRTIEFDLEADGTMTAIDKSDSLDITTGAGLISEGKGHWSVENEKLTITMTHVWMAVFWKEHRVDWVNEENLTRLTDKRILLEKSAALMRK